MSPLFSSKIWIGVFSLFIRKGIALLLFYSIFRITFFSREIHWSKSHLYYKTKTKVESAR